MSRGERMSRRVILRRAGAGSISLALANFAESAQEGEQHNAISAPSISNLKSMRDQVKPITQKERQQRIEKAKQLMAEQKMDAILLVGGTSQLYFTGIRWGNSE